MVNIPDVIMYCKTIAGMLHNKDMGASTYLKHSMIHDTVKAL